MHGNSYANKTEKLLKEKLWLVIGKSIILFDELCYWVLKSKSKIKQLLHRPCKMEFDAINLTDGWTKWKETMQLHLTASINGKADNEKYTVLFFMIGEKWRDRFGFWNLLHHFLVKYAFRSVRMGNYSQYYPVNPSVPQNAIFGPMFFLPYTDLLDDVLCNIVKSVKEIVTGMKS